MHKTFYLFFQPAVTHSGMLPYTALLLAASAAGFRVVDKTREVRGPSYIAAVGQTIFTDGE